MNEVIERAVRMSTVEIAELTGKQHRNVLRDARKMLAELEGSGPLKSEQSFEGSYRNSQGKEQPCLDLPQREVMILITGYSAILRARVIDRWRELEAGQEQPALASPSGPSEPPADLFPLPNAMERLTGTALEQIKRFGTSVWQAKDAIFKRLDSGERWLNQESAKRDHWLAEQTIGARKATETLGAEVREVTRLLTREPNWITMSEMLRDQGVDACGLVSRLSKEAEAWFTARSFRLQIASPQSNLRATWFERTHLLWWWKQEGEKLYRQFLAKRIRPTLRLVHGAKQLNAAASSADPRGEIA